MSPQSGRPLLQDPHTSMRQLSILSTNLQKTFTTTENIRVILSRGIFSMKSQKYLRPIFWFLFSSSVFSLSCSIDRIPLSQSSQALFGPTPQTLLNSSIVILFQLCCNRYNFYSLPVSRSSFTFLTILEPTPLRFSRSWSDSISLLRLRIADTALRQAIFLPISFSFSYIFWSFINSSQMNLFIENVYIEVLVILFWHRKASLFSGFFYRAFKLCWFKL